MLDELKAWDASPPTDAPNLIVISSGSVDQNQALGLRSHVFSDTESLASSAFGATARPWPFCSTLKERVASNPVAGKNAVFSLAGPVTETPSNSGTSRGPKERELLVL